MIFEERVRSTNMEKINFVCIILSVCSNFQRKVFILLRDLRPKVLGGRSKSRAEACNFAASGGASIGAVVTGGDITLISVKM